MVPGIVLTTVVAIATWMTPMPKQANGLLVLYGPPSLAQINAEFHGYDLKDYACGLSLMSPADLGKVVWVRKKDGKWFGPCLSIDTARRQDFWDYVYNKHEVAEVDSRAADALGFDHGIKGEVYVGLCPPDHGQAVDYNPDLAFDEFTQNDSYMHYFWPYPPQQRPCLCAVYGELSDHLQADPFPPPAVLEDAALFRFQRLPERRQQHGYQKAR